MAAVAYATYSEQTIQPRLRRERVSSTPSTRVTRFQPRVSQAALRRRRLGAAMLATFVLLVAGVVLGRLGAGPLASSEKVHTLIAEHTYVVQPGDTDWGIAQSVQKSGDIRPLVSYIANEHKGRSLQVGDTITLP